eukprot:scaffold2.g6814.t1
MDVVPPEPEPTAEPNGVDEDMPPLLPAAPPAKTDDPLYGEQEIHFKDFSTLSGRVLSEPFQAGGYTWQLLCFPRGNNSNPQCVSLYLAVPEEDQHLGWARSATFRLILLSRTGPAHVKESQHTFTAQANDWGFTSFISLTEVHDPTRGFLEGDEMVVKVEVSVTVPEDLRYDTRAATGFVGLKNQGATCYMNSLLQTLYNINQFRRLQFTPGPVSTKDLTRSFGWDTSDAFQQHDVHELYRGTRVEGAIDKLFHFHAENFIECVNVDYRSTRRELFADLQAREDLCTGQGRSRPRCLPGQGTVAAPSAPPAPWPLNTPKQRAHTPPCPLEQLDVKGCRSIYDSFDKYCEVVTLDGENQYNAESHGMQDARKGLLFDSLPPVLQLQLKRFEYDYIKEQQLKINDRYEFYDELDLDRDGRKYLAQNADKGTRNRYKLLAVLVHSGGVHGGHYYAYIRPDGQQWLRFDDERVEKVDPKQAVEDNWGVDGGELRLGGGGLGDYRIPPKFANAYMLVYVRESDWPSVMCAVTEQDISEHAEQQEREQRKREKAEAHLYLNARIATDADMRAQAREGARRSSVGIGDSQFFDLVDHAKVRTFKLSKKTQFRELQVIRDASRGYDRQPSQGVMASLDLYLELPEASAESGALAPRGKHDLLLFLKAYTPAPEPRVTYAGHTLMHKNSKVQELFPRMRELGGLKEQEPLQVFEEIKFEPNVMVDLLSPGSTLANAQLEDGDVLIFQRSLPEAEARSVPHPTARDFMTYVRKRLSVTFKRLEEPQEEGLRLEMRKDDSYEEVSAALAARLCLEDPRRLRFTGFNGYSLTPRTQPYRWGQVSTLEDMLRGYGMQPLASVLFYEVIDLPLEEFEKLVTLKIHLHNSKLEEGKPHSVRIARDRPVGELLEELRSQLAPEEHQGRPLRLMEVYQWRIWQIYDPADPVSSISDNFWHLRAEVVRPEEEGLGAPGGPGAVQCLQVTEEDHNKAFAFSDPFVMAVGPEETVGQLRERVRAKLEVPSEELEKWGTLLLPSMGSPEPLGDEVVIAQRLPAADLQRLYGHADRACIGFQHECKDRRRTNKHLRRNASWHGQEKKLTIK